MQILLFSKQPNGQTEKRLLDWDSLPESQLMKTITSQGVVCLIRKSDFKSIEDIIQRSEFRNCGIRHKKIELYRALKLDITRDRKVPRRIIINTLTIGAFKRSFFPFIRKRYQFEDPACMLYIPDAMMEPMIEDPPQKKLRIKDNDPIYSLLQNLSAERTVQQIHEVYLGESLNAHLTCAMIFKASQSKSPVLVLGESGTGKDLIANQIYTYSKYYNKKFQVVNCSALQETLLESELFGHIKGSFTGAIATKKGLLSVTRGGTIFLDEIGDLSLPNQAKILHAVENKKIRAIGSNISESIDVRIIAATNRNLASMISRKLFREDLYYRLNTFTILTTPLREYPEDIPVIASVIWSKFNTRHTLSPEFLNYLKEYHWPGNVRELKTMLNSIIDIFGHVPPSPSLVEAIRKYRNDRLQQSGETMDGGFPQTLELRSRNRMIEVQNILSGIKILLEPVIHDQLAKKGHAAEIKKIQSATLKENEKIEDLCREPIYFKDPMLFDNIKRFHHLLENSIAQWPDSFSGFSETWRQELGSLHDNINRAIFQMIWNKVAM